MSRCTTPESLLEKMESTDTDFRFMALNDLINDLKNGSLEQKSLSCKLVKKSLELLQDSHGEVQSLAVNAVSTLFQKVIEIQANAIVDEIIVGLCHGTQADYRSICVLALKSLVNSTSPENPKLVSILTDHSIPSLIDVVRSSGNSAVQIECCEILGNMVARFGESLLSSHPDIMQCILDALNSSQPGLRKRAVQIIPNLLPFEDNFSTLLAFVKERFDKVMAPSSQQQDLTVSHFKITLQCLIALARDAERLASRASELISDGLIDCLLGSNVTESVLPRLRREFGDPDSYDVANEYVELSLQCMENLLRARQRTATQSSYLSRLLDTHFDKVVSVLANLVRYDPLNTATSGMDVTCGSDEEANGFHRKADDSSDMEGVEDKDEDEDEDDGDDDYDDDEDDENDNFDTSWKVRNSAAKVMNSFMQSYSGKLGNFYATLSPVIVSRLSEEQNESVRMELFSCLNTLLRATTLKNPNSLSIRLSRNTPQVLLLRLMPLIFKNLRPFIASSAAKRSRRTGNTAIFTKASPSSHLAVLNLIRGLAVALPGHLGAYMETILNVVEGDFNEHSIANSVKIDLVKLLQLIVKTHEYKDYEAFSSNLNELTIRAISDPFYRVRYEGMELAQVLVRRRPLENVISLTPVFPSLLAQLQVTKCDLELKEKAMDTASTFIEHLGQDLSPTSIQECLDKFTACLNDGSSRIAAIRSMSIVFANPLSIKQCPASRDTIKALLGMLQAHDSNLRVAVIHCIIVICSNFPRDFILSEDKYVEAILPILPKLISDLKPTVSQEALELAAVLLKQCSRADVVQQIMVADFFTESQFLKPVVGLATKSHLQAPLLTALLHLMQSIGMYRPNNHNLSVNFMITKLLEPLQHITAVDTSDEFSQIKETLPNLARVCSELILQLPRYGQLNSIDSTLEEMVSELKKKTTPYAKRYLYVIIFGDIGYRIDISHRGDVFDVLMDHIAMNKSIVPETERELASNGEATTSLSSATTSTPPTLTSGSGFSELRPLAATNLSRLVAGEPATLVHELLQFFKRENEQNLVLYYLFQTLRQTIINLVEIRSAEYIYRNVEEIWTLLMANAGHTEEGTRSTVAECLGRVTLLQPQELIPRLHAELKSSNSPSSNQIRCTLVTAFKFLLSVAASINYPDDENAMASVSDTLTVINASVTTLNDRQHLVQILLEGSRFLDVLAHILDADAEVCRAALITFNTAAHYWPTLIRPLLSASIGPDKRNLLEEVYRGTLVKQELIRMVQMGPFKVYFDDGIELRKTAYECMSTLLESYVDRLSMAAFLQPLIDGLKDRNNHVKLTVCHILRRVVQLAPIDIVDKMLELSQALTVILQLQPKGDLVKQESEKLNEVKTCALTVVAEFPKIPDIRKNQYYCQLIKVIRSDKSLTSLWTEVAGL